jgi:hypothetical protein
VGISAIRKWEFNATLKMDAAARLITGSPALGVISILIKVKELG